MYIHIHNIYVYIYIYIYIYAMLLCGSTTASTHIKGFTVWNNKCINWHKYMYVCMYVCIMHIYIYMQCYYVALLQPLPILKASLYVI
jgi:hypothetical protein